MLELVRGTGSLNVRNTSSLERLARRSYRNNIERGGTKHNSYVMAVLDVKDKLTGQQGLYQFAPDPHKLVRDALGMQS